MLLALAGTASAHAALLYSVTDLGDLPGGENASEAFAINNRGQVVGVSSVVDGRRAFLYSNGALTDLGVLEADHRYSMATDINDLGEVSGRSIIDEELWNTQSLRPFLYRNGQMVPLGSLGGGYGFANSINNVSEVVGLSSDANGVTHAFLWSSGAMSDLGSLEGGSYSCAYGINDNTQVVGTSVLNGFLWQNGQMSDLGDLVGGLGRTLAFAVNNLSQVVGYSGPLDSEHSFPFVWQDGVMEYLGSPSDPTPSGYARGINNRGEVVGVVSGYPFVWDSVNGMQDLNDLLDDSGAGWRLTHAYDINDRGQIVGFGRNPSGFSHGFLLTPIPEPATIIIWSLLGALATTVGCWRRRRAA
ncbi:MAG: hypothetical protein A2V70_18525 [Planctomycetes bacterium RBG_13_63_9]|nr:MAG: hypothetical protein A2V70_18525 [Planctomycetes bacterium RBG_13_63_9]